MSKKGKIIVLLKKILFALGVLFFLTIFSMLPNFGYFGRTIDVTIEGEDDYGNLYVLACCDVTYNPFLYPVSWLDGNGHFRGGFRFISMALYGAYVSPSTGDYFPRRYYPSKWELMEEALSALTLHQLYISIPFNFIIVLLIGLLRVEDLYLCIFGGVVGFPIGGEAGAFLFFLALLLVSVYVRLRVAKEGIIIKVWNSIML